MATVLVATWTDEIDKDRVEEVLSGREPFDESDYLYEDYEEEQDGIDREPTRSD